MLGVGSIVCLTLGINYMLAISAVQPMYPGSWKIFAIACVVPQTMGNATNENVTSNNIMDAFEALGMREAIIENI